LIKRFNLAAGFGVLAVSAAGILALATPAHAAADDCKSVTVDLPARPDSGIKGNNWATNKMSRELTVCATPAEGNVWTYKATVGDTGTFTTAAGASPNGTATLKGGAKGKIKGGFTATFTAPKDWNGKATLATPAATTPTSEWVATAFPAATFNDKGAVAAWSWTYTTACESWTNAESGNKGDIAEKVCAAKVEFTNATCKDSKAYVKVTNPNSHATLAVAFNGAGKTIPKAGSVTHEFTSGVVLVEARQMRPQNYTYKAATGCATNPPPAGGSTGGNPTTPALPVTGTSLPLIAGGGIALLVMGAGAVWLTRRRVRIEA
jgi:hypothetical protein